MSNLVASDANNCEYIRWYDVCLLEPRVTHLYILLLKKNWIIPGIKHISQKLGRLNSLQKDGEKHHQTLAKKNVFEFQNMHGIFYQEAKLWQSCSLKF